MTNAELITLLKNCYEKLMLYRQRSSGEYVGGVEYTELQRRIEKALADLSSDQPTEDHG